LGDLHPARADVSGVVDVLDEPLADLPRVEQLRPRLPSGKARGHRGCVERERFGRAPRFG